MQRFIHIRQVTLLNNGALWHFCTTHQRSGPQLIGVIWEPLVMIREPLGMIREPSGHIIQGMVREPLGVIWEP